MIKKLLARLLPPKNHFHGGLHITPPPHKNMSTAYCAANSSPNP